MNRHRQRAKRPLSAEEVEWVARQQDLGVGGLPPEAYDWSYVPAFQLARVGPPPGLPLDRPSGRDEWVAFLHDERVDEGADIWGDDFATWVQRAFAKVTSGGEVGADVPVVLVRVGNLYQPWDGRHRIGVAHEAGLRAVPAFVGVPR